MKRFNNKLIYIQYIPEENFINKKFEPIIWIFLTINIII
jgi:hypothetical protein